ncbi:hypothetical protein QUQ58_004726 [Escherichia coli]|nr:hypothetical protein [Escherichia coli]
MGWYKGISVSAERNPSLLEGRGKPGLSLVDFLLVFRKKRNILYGTETTEYLSMTQCNKTAIKICTVLFSAIMPLFPLMIKLFAHFDGYYSVIKECKV